MHFRLIGCHSPYSFDFFFFQIVIDKHRCCIHEIICLLVRNIVLIKIITNQWSDHLFVILGQNNEIILLNTKLKNRWNVLHSPENIKRVYILTISLFYYTLIFFILFFMIILRKSILTLAIILCSTTLVVDAILKGGRGDGCFTTVECDQNLQCKNQVCSR